jgi:hypothetical protein
VGLGEGALFPEDTQHFVLSDDTAVFAIKFGQQHRITSLALRGRPSEIVTELEGQ